MQRWIGLRYRHPVLQRDISPNCGHFGRIYAAHFPKERLLNRVERIAALRRRQGHVEDRFGHLDGERYVLDDLAEASARSDGHLEFAVRAFSDLDVVLDEDWDYHRANRLINLFTMFFSYFLCLFVTTLTLMTRCDRILGGSFHLVARMIGFSRSMINFSFKLIMGLIFVKNVFH